MIGTVETTEQRSAAEGSVEASPPARVRVLQAMQDWIRDGVLEPGSRLPSERALAQRLDADRATVRRAVDILIDQGLVREHSPRTRTVAPLAKPSALMARTVAVLTPQASEISAHRQEGWIEFIDHGVAAALRATDWHALFLHPSILRDNVGDLVSGTPCGVLITELGAEWPEARQVAHALGEAGVPVVVFGESEEWAAFDRVVSDHAGGAAALTRWLLDRGCGNILQILPTGKGAWPVARRAGYERTMVAADRAPLSLLNMPDMETASTPDQFELRARTVAGYLAPVFQHQAVDAIMVASDGDLAPVSAACRLLGREPQRDIRIVGYDNYWRECMERRFESTAPLATVDKRNAEIGRELVRLLGERCDGKLPAEPQQRFVQPRLVEVAGN